MCTALKQKLLFGILRILSSKAVSVIYLVQTCQKISECGGVYCWPSLLVCCMELTLFLFSVSKTFIAHVFETFIDIQTTHNILLSDRLTLRSDLDQFVKVKTSFHHL